MRAEFDWAAVPESLATSNSKLTGQIELHNGYHGEKSVPPRWQTHVVITFVN